MSTSYQTNSQMPAQSPAMATIQAAADKGLNFMDSASADAERMGLVDIFERIMKKANAGAESSV
jgi:hypothetical protein